MFENFHRIIEENEPTISVRDRLNRLGLLRLRYSEFYEPPPRNSPSYDYGKFQGREIIGPDSRIRGGISVGSYPRELS